MQQSISFTNLKRLLQVAVLEVKLKVREPSSYNQLNDILIIGLYLWLNSNPVPIPVLKDGKLDLLVLTIHYTINN